MAADSSTKRLRLNVSIAASSSSSIAAEEEYKAQALEERKRNYNLGVGCYTRATLCLIATYLDTPERVQLGASSMGLRCLLQSPETRTPTGWYTMDQRAPASALRGASKITLTGVYVVCQALDQQQLDQLRVVGQSVPGVPPVTGLSWAGDIFHFSMEERCRPQAIAHLGRCMIPLARTVTEGIVQDKRRLYAAFSLGDTTYGNMLWYLRSIATLTLPEPNSTELLAIQRVDLKLRSLTVVHILPMMPHITYMLQCERIADFHTSAPLELREYLTLCRNMLSVRVFHLRILRCTPDQFNALNNPGTYEPDGSEYNDPFAAVDTKSRTIVFDRSDATTCTCACHGVCEGTGICANELTCISAPECPAHYVPPLRLAPPSPPSRHAF
jgi:hypothetical protein